jgi:hypothetical protein
MKRRGDVSVYSRHTKYSSGEVSESYNDIGQVEPHYSAGGYVAAYFLETLNDTMSQDVWLLRRANWIDTATRVVDFNFILYSVNTDRFVGAQFLFEVLPTGKVVSRFRFTPFRPSQFETSRESSMRLLGFGVGPQ